MKGRGSDFPSKLGKSIEASAAEGVGTVKFSGGVVADEDRLALNTRCYGP